ncbi:hypothetical protein NDU88_009557, partial [Pleurodeles waltl]
TAGTERGCVECSFPCMRMHTPTHTIPHKHRQQALSEDVWSAASLVCACIHTHTPTYTIPHTRRVGTEQGCVECSFTCMHTPPHTPSRTNTEQALSEDVWSAASHAHPHTHTPTYTQQALSK